MGTFDSKDKNIFYLPVYKDLAAVYQRIVEENKMVWEGYENDVVEAVKKECLINGNFTKK